MEVLIITRNQEIPASISGPALKYISSFLFSNNYTFGTMTSPGTDRLLLSSIGKEPEKVN